MANIAKEKLESGAEISIVYEHLDEIMVSKWRSIPSTRMQYLDSVKKILVNQNVLIG